MSTYFFKLSLLVNKLKPKSTENSQIVARSINYEDEIPQLQNV